MLMTLKDLFALACCSIPDSGRAIPRPTYNFFRDSLTQAVYHIFVSLKEHVGISRCVNVHNFPVLACSEESVSVEPLKQGELNMKHLLRVDCQNKAVVVGEFLFEGIPAIGLVETVQLD